MAIFKNGDRVRIARGPNNGGFGAIGDVGTIATVDGTACEVRFETGKEAGDVWWVGHDYLELIHAAATLTIQAGKCYRTRDGRKVGPMRLFNGGWTAHYDVEGRMWKTDGTRLFGGNEHTNLIAEWIDEPAAAPKPVAVAGSNDNGPAPVAGQPAANDAGGGFKAGDRIRLVSNPCGDCQIGDEYTAIARLDRRSVDSVHYTDKAGYTTWRPGSYFELATTTRSIVCLIENGQPKPADHPHVHTCRSEAEHEATRLAGKHKGKEFGVFELVTTKREAAPVYAHEWQRLAAGGRRIDAIKELRRLTGMGLRPTKDAVEHFLQAA